MIGRILGRLLNLPALLRYMREHRADRSVWDPAEDLELQLYGAIFGNNFLHYGYFREIPASADEISLADVSRAMDDYASLLVERVKPGERVLDVGCGMGGLLNRLDRAGAKPTGVTPNRAHAQHIRAGWPHIPLIESPFEQVDAVAIDPKFDAERGWMVDAVQLRMLAGKQPSWWLTATCKAAPTAQVCCRCACFKVGAPRGILSVRGSLLAQALLRAAHTASSRSCHTRLLTRRKFQQPS
jgi:hypothetical protein